MRSGKLDRSLNFGNGSCLDKITGRAAHFQSGERREQNIFLDYHVRVGPT